MLTYSADCGADPDTAWRLMSRPDQWSRWAPHVQGARGLGEPEVRTGARGHVLLLGGVALPAHVASKQAHRCWSGAVGPLRLRHRLTARGSGCRVAVDVEAGLMLEPLLRVTYGPLVAALVHNLARVAAQDARAALGAPVPARAPEPARAPDAYSSPSTSAAARSPERTAPSM